MNIRVTVHDRYIKDYPGDIRVIRTAFREKGYSVTKEQATAMWREHSEGWAASWLDASIHSKDEIFELLEPYFEVI